MGRNMNRKESLSDLVLLVLEKAVDGIARFEDFAHHSHYYSYGRSYPIKKSAISKAIKRLREQGLIDFINKEEKQLVLRLTDPGRDKALWVKMMEDEEKWDGKWRLVFWDIPEQKRAVRDLLRGKLKRLGFVRWQKSVWASKKNCTEILRSYVRSVGIEEWVFVVESD